MDKLKNFKKILIEDEGITMYKIYLIKSIQK